MENYASYETHPMGHQNQVNSSLDWLTFVNQSHPIFFSKLSKIKKIKTLYFLLYTFFNILKLRYKITHNL